MVKITFSLLSIAAVVASVVSASSCAQDTFDSDYRGGNRGNKCLPSGSVKEYQTFQLKSYNLRSIVSKEPHDNILVAGIRGNKMLQELEMCIVSTDGECNPPYPTNCIYENVEYRFRVNGPTEGYLRISDNFVEIVDDFSQASPLNLQMMNEYAALRVGYKDHHNEMQVFSAPRAGQPIVVEKAVANKVSQWMELRKTETRKGRFDFCPRIQPRDGQNKYVPDVALKEYRPFHLKSYNLNSLVSKGLDSDIIIDGVNGNKDFQELDLCVVSRAYGCSTGIISNCIYGNVPYHLRISQSIQGYLKVDGDEVTIVQNYDDASELNLYKDEANWPCRGCSPGFTAATAGNPFVLEEVVLNKKSQWVEIEEVSDFKKKKAIYCFW
ncbi:hypothetical protein BGZ81_002937 [Podila clonocystis]|nr:hypothetical protein BGZ81_002937 [Podila clonocystis]